MFLLSVFQIVKHHLTTFLKPDVYAVTMTVYAELIFFDNFITDYFILFISMRSSASRIQPLFIAAGAACGGAYAIAAAIFPVLGLSIIRVISGALLCTVAACPKKPSVIADAYLRFLVFSLLLSGCVFTIECFLKSTSTIWITVKCILVGAAVCLTVFELYNRRSAHLSRKYTVKAIINKQEVSFSAVFDSGAAVTDENGGGVIIADNSVFTGMDFDCAGSNIKKRSFKLSTLTGSASLTGIIPDELYITDGSIIYRARAYIIIANGINIDGCSALIGRGIKLTKEGRINEDIYFYKTCI